ncbi:MAG: hypothetical protein IPP48_07835 [Chitinophagaceae bacterium]|nr:hypothetical protein [Chitinophagaceae bacterium]
MKKQMLFAAIAVVLVISLFFFGNTVAKKDPTIMPPARVAKTFNINDFITESKKKLTVSQAEYLSKLENSVTRGDVSSQQIKVYNALANFWKDSVKAL